MITVHHLNNSRSQRILWLLEELALPYRIHLYQRQPSMAAPDELKGIHPLGKAPLVEDDDGGGRVLVETGAICEYLVRKAGGRLGEPQDEAGSILYRQFLHYAEGSVMPILFSMLVAKRIPIMGRMVVRKIRPMVDVHLDFIEAELSSRPWFAGDTLTAADIMMSFPLEAAKSRSLTGVSHPSIDRWLDAIHSRPAYRRGLQKGGDYAFAR